jgi:hypothetical protein
LALSVSERPWRKWVLRSMAAFLLVYMAGAFGFATLILYVAVLLAVVVDALRLAIQNRRGNDVPPSSERKAHVRRETIH